MFWGIGMSMLLPLRRESGGLEGGWRGMPFLFFSFFLDFWGIGWMYVGIEWGMMEVLVLVLVIAR